MKNTWRWLLALVVLTACTPALNWRQVSLDRITVLLPCKPDRAERTVRLADADVTISMAGCEAGGMLFAVSHTHQANVVASASIGSAWRVATLANMHAASIQELPMPQGSASGSVTRLSAQGVRPDATPIQAQLAWLVAGADVFHLAVYGDRLTPESVDSFFSDIKIQ